MTCLSLCDKEVKELVGILISDKKFLDISWHDHLPQTFV